MKVFYDYRWKLITWNFLLKNHQKFGIFWQTQKTNQKDSQKCAQNTNPNIFYSKKQHHYLPATSSTAVSIHSVSHSHMFWAINAVYTFTIYVYFPFDSFFSAFFSKLFRLSMCSVCFITSLFSLFLLQEEDSASKKSRMKEKLLKKKLLKTRREFFLNIHTFFIIKQVFRLLYALLFI